MVALLVRSSPSNMKRQEPQLSVAHYVMTTHVYFGFSVIKKVCNFVLCIWFLYMSVRPVIQCRNLLDLETLQQIGVATTDLAGGSGHSD
jgi:hypothetical protein